MERHILLEKLVESLILRDGRLLGCHLKLPFHALFDPREALEDLSGKVLA
jgi:hypothetical protein